MNGPSLENTGLVDITEPRRPSRAAGGFCLLGESSLSPPASGGAEARLTTGSLGAQGALKFAFTHFRGINFRLPS